MTDEPRPVHVQPDADTGLRPHDFWGGADPSMGGDIDRAAADLGYLTFKECAEIINYVFSRPDPFDGRDQSMLSAVL